MKKRKKIEIKYIILIVLLVIAIFLGFATKIVHDERPLNPIEKAIKDSVLFVQKIVASPVNGIKNMMKENQEKKDLYNKYKELEEKVKKVNILESEKAELKLELESMKKTLELNKTLSEAEYLNATVINRDIGFWYDTITIDKGSKNGVKENMPVIVSEGLIGKVIKTSNFNSTVKLMTTTDSSNKISIKIALEDKYIYGLLSGYNPENKTYIVEGISDNSTIPIGSIVTTTGMGDTFPSGIIVGKVKNITTDNFDLAKIIEVESEVNFEALDFVTILKRK